MRRPRPRPLSPQGHGRPEVVRSPAPGGGAAREGQAPPRFNETEVRPAQTAEHPIPEQTLRRVPQYHQILVGIASSGARYVSSRQLAVHFGIDDTQVRKDVSLIGYKGKPKAGYSVDGLKTAIEEFLGINYENTAILVGVGHLGSALSQYPGLAQYGLRLVAVFDNDPAKIGSVVGGFTILPMDGIQRVMKSFDIGIAIVCVPKQAAQEVADQVVANGIRAIWNFAPTRLSVPGDVVVRDENIALGLAILSHYVKRRNQAERRAPSPGRSATQPAGLPEPPAP